MCVYSLHFSSMCMTCVTAKTHIGGNCFLTFAFYNRRLYIINNKQQQKYLLTQIIYKAMIHEYTEYKISKIE